MAQQQIALQHGARTDSSAIHPYMTPFGHFNRHGVNGVHAQNGKSQFNGFKSAFTPLSPTSAYPSLHSAFAPRSSGFSAESIIGRGPILHATTPTSRSTGDILAMPPHFPYPGLTSIPSSLPAGFPSPFLIHPYRPFGQFESMPASKEPTISELTEKSVIEHPSVGDRWKDGSPGREVKEND